MKLGTCIFFTGIQNEICKAGRRYETQSGGKFIPCLKHMAASQGKETNPCDGYTDPTAEQLASYEAYADEQRQRMQKVAPLCRTIKHDHAGHYWRGNATCPNCGRNIRLEHRPNGHMTVACDTVDCCSFIE